MFDECDCKERLGKKQCALNTNSFDQKVDVGKKKKKKKKKVASPLHHRCINIAKSMYK